MKIYDNELPRFYTVKSLVNRIYKVDIIARTINN